MVLIYCFCYEFGENIGKYGKKFNILGYLQAGGHFPFKIGQEVENNSSLFVIFVYYVLYHIKIQNF